LPLFTRLHLGGSRDADSGVSLFQGIFRWAGGSVGGSVVVARLYFIPQQMPHNHSNADTGDLSPSKPRVELNNSMSGGDPV